MNRLKNKYQQTLANKQNLSNKININSEKPAFNILENLNPNIMNNPKALKYEI